MKEYTPKQIKELEKNPYVHHMTKHMIYYTAKFKEDFWISYQAGNAPRKILSDFGFDLEIFGQKQIDSLVQHIKKQALSGNGFSEGENRTKRVPIKETNEEDILHICYIAAKKMKKRLRFMLVVIYSLQR